eukprot:g52455.t1
MPSECGAFNGCMYKGRFALYDDTKSLSWVQSNSIIAFYDNSNPSGSQWRTRYGGKRVRLSKEWAGKTYAWESTIVDTCGNGDCGNCCADNANPATGYLVDIEYWSALKAFGTTDAVQGNIEFTILGDTPTPSKSPTNITDTSEDSTDTSTDSTDTSTDSTDTSTDSSDTSTDSTDSMRLASGSASPGANYNLGGWTLQLPTGSDGNVDTASGSSLEGGFTKKPYFYTDTADGAMVMMDPSRGWATSGSQHPRVELREGKTWKSGTHQSDATLKVTKISGSTAIGQILGVSPSKPLCELFYSSSGTVSLYMANSNEGGAGGVTTTISNVPVGTKFSYSLKYSANKVTATVNGTSKTFTANSSFKNTNAFYFKAGNYAQSATIGSPTTSEFVTVKFYALSTSHN